MEARSEPLHMSLLGEEAAPPSSARPAAYRRMRPTNNYAEFFGADNAFDESSHGHYGGANKDGGRDLMQDGDGYMTLDAQSSGPDSGLDYFGASLLSGRSDYEDLPDGVPQREERCFRCVRALDQCFDGVPCCDGYEGVRFKTWQIVSGKASKYGQRTRFMPSLIFEGTISVLIVVNIIMAILVSENSYAEDPSFISAYSTTEIISTFIFSVEYVLRLWASPAGRFKKSKRFKRSRRTGEIVRVRYGCCSSRLRWITSPLSILDAIVLAGFYVDSFAIVATLSSGAKSGMAALRLLRLLSIFRFERHSKGLKYLKTVLARKVPELILALFVSAILLMVSSTLLYAIEGPHYQDFDSISKSLWWSAMTVTTVGYGDVYPHTAGGKIVASFVAFLGVCLFALPSAVLGSGLIEVMTEGRHRDHVHRQRQKTKIRLQEQKQRLQGRNLSSGHRVNTESQVKTRLPANKSTSKASQGVTLEMTATRPGEKPPVPTRVSSMSNESIEGSMAGAMNLFTSSVNLAGTRRDTTLPSFSESFDPHNGAHVAAAVCILLGDGSDLFNQHWQKLLPPDFWTQFGPEAGGIVGLHATLTRRLAEEYLLLETKLLDKGQGVSDDSSGASDDDVSGPNELNDDTAGFFKL